MSDQSTSTRRSLTESPWYWIYLFASAGLIALMLAGPKFAARQAQIERKSQGRQRAVAQQAGREPVTPLSEAGSTRIDLRPLYYLLSLLLVVTFGHWVWSRRRHPTVQEGAS